MTERLDFLGIFFSSDGTELKDQPKEKKDFVTRIITAFFTIITLNTPYIKHRN